MPLQKMGTKKYMGNFCKGRFCDAYGTQKKLKKKSRLVDPYLGINHSLVFTNQDRETERAKERTYLATNIMNVLHK